MNRILSITHTYTFVLFLLCLLFICFCSQAKAQKEGITETKYEIESVEVGKQGTYLVKVFVYTDQPTATMEQFLFAAVHGIIFKGFNGKNFAAQKPLVQIDTNNQHFDLNETFFNNGNYTDYATVVTPHIERIKIGKEYKIAAIVLVSKDELRKSLEDIGVIKSLNSGF